MKNSKMKLFSLLILLISICTQLFAQVGCDELSNFKKKKDVLIQVGFSTSEVKAKIGNPKTIEGGFPEITGCTVANSPKMIGQMNNSTWFYSYKPIPVKDVGYYINGITTTEELFLEYQGSRTVNLVDGKIASKEMAGHYARANNNNLSVVPIENKTTYFNTNPNTTKLVIPVYCVIFDRGTQVVANTEAFFISN